MPCDERDRLLDLLLKAAEEHVAALRAIRKGEARDLQRLTALAASARNAYNDCYAVLVAHERAHGCNEEPPTE
jgi:hypothetical protein